MGVFVFMDGCNRAYVRACVHACVNMVIRLMLNILLITVDFFTLLMHLILLGYITDFANIALN